MALALTIAQKLIKYSPKTRKGASSTVLTVAIGAIAMSMAVMLVAVGIVGGFKNEIRAKVAGFGGHVLVEPYDESESYEVATPLEVSAQFLNNISSIAGVKAAQPFILKAGMIKANDETDKIVAKGLARGFDRAFLEGVLVSGKLPAIGDTAASKDILLSKYFANRLNLKVGDGLILYFLVKNDTRKRKLTVCGIYDSGFEEFDKVFGYTDIALLQQLNGWQPNQAAGVEVLANNFDDVNPIANALLTTMPPDVEVRTIQQVRPDIFTWLDMQDVNAFIIITLMLFVSVINIVSSVLVLVLERTPMIGMLKAMGANNGFIRQIFIHYSGFLLSTGLLLGNAFGLLLCFLQIQFKIIKLPKESYYVDQVPVEVNWLNVLSLNALVIVSALVVLWLSSFIVRQISPVKAIKLR